MLSADGYLMPAKKNQQPPDLRYFSQSQKRPMRSIMACLLKLCWIDLVWGQGWLRLGRGE